MTARAWRPAAVALAAFLAAGCASFPETGRLDRYDPDKGYRYELLEANGNDDELFVVLTFSGGGTRAAAFSYGVLEELRKTTVTMNGERRNLLKEVDMISSISGGSFTAAYYGLRGDEIFQEGGRFQRNFLYRDVKGQLIGSLFNPYNWLRLASPEFGRIELATELYQELLFDNATFRDLERQARKPYLMINATDMTKGSQFTFVQPQFDPLCADLATVPIARAVAASSNFPIAFTPLTLNSYPGRCNYTEPLWVENALNDLDVNPRRYYSARLLRTYQEKNRGYIHLLDGGVADNIGLRGPLTSLTSGDVSPSILNKLNNKQINKLVVIVADAKNETPNPADRSPSAPDLPAVVNSIATVPLDNYSFDTLELLQKVFRERDRNQRLQPGLHQVEIYRIYIGFDQIKDEAERARFFSIATAFDLPKEQVDAAPQGRRAAPAIALPQGAARVRVGSGATGRFAPVSVKRLSVRSVLKYRYGGMTYGSGGTKDHPGETADHRGGTTDHRGGMKDHRGRTKVATGGTTSTRPATSSARVRTTLPSRDLPTACACSRSRVDVGWVRRAVCAGTHRTHPRGPSGADLMRGLPEGG